MSVKRIEDSIRTGHVQWTHDAKPIKFAKVSKPCVVCQLAKSKRRPFSHSIPKFTQQAQHWFMDVWGPNETPSLLYMNVYTVGFRDAMSGALWIFHTRTKDAVLDCVKALYSKVIQPRRVSHGLTSFVIQSDNGEFKSNAVLDFLRYVGGDRLTCCAYSPETMGKIERMWSIIHNMVCAMLIGKKLHECYWEFAENYACRI